jgi:hypothetical protein
MSSYRTLNDLLKAFRDIGGRHQQINTFFVGQDFDLGNETVRHPILSVNPVSAVLPKNENGYSLYSVNFTVKVMDLVNKNKSNEEEVLSDNLEVLKDIVTEFNTHPFYIESDFNIEGDISFSTVRGVFDSDLTGWETEITIVAPNKSYFCGLPLNSLNGVEYYPDLVANVKNSDNTYNTTVIVAQTLELPDITHTNSNGSPVTLPAQTPFVATVCTESQGIAYSRPIYSGVTTSYRVGDEGYHFQNGTFDYTPPVFPISHAKLDLNAANPFVTLVDNNAFGNKNRFTYLDGTQTYTTNYAIDHLTGLGWNYDLYPDTGWNAHIDNSNASTFGGFTDWRLPAMIEWFTIFDRETSASYKGRGLSYSPFLILTQPIFYSSTTRQDVTTEYLRFECYYSGLIGNESKTGVNRNRMIVRNHYT